jgi:hypothetical protein
MSDISGKCEFHGFVVSDEFRNIECGQFGLMFAARRISPDSRLF